MQLVPRFAAVLADYERVLRQRNTLLKSARGARVAEGQLSTLEIWDERLVALGSEIIVGRQGLVDRLRPHVAAAYASIAGDEHRAELASQLSIWGARPDEEIAVDVEPAREPDAADGRRAVPRRARPGAARRVGPRPHPRRPAPRRPPARAERAARAGLCEPRRVLVVRAGAEAGVGGGAQGRLGASAIPSLILDDVFAELDEGRRAKLASAIGDYEQVLITAAVFDDVPAPLAAHTVRILAGRIVEDGS